MPSRIAAHLRSNVIGYVALFFSVSFGTAWATHPGGANTISSGDIIDKTVRAQDLRDEAVSGAKLGPSAVGSAKVADDSLTDLDIEEETLNDVDAETLSGLTWSDFVTQIDANIPASVGNKVVTTTNAATEVVENPRWRLETTGTAHQFRVCADSLYDNPMAIIQYVGGGIASTASTRDFDSVTPGTCQSFSTGGVNNASPSDFTLVGPHMIVFGTPYVQNTATTDPEAYHVFALGWAVDSP